SRDPGGERIRLLELIESLHCADERVLRDFVGIRPRELGSTHRAHPHDVASVEFAERVPITVTMTRDKRGIVVTLSVGQLERQTVRLSPMSSRIVAPTSRIVQPK